MKKSVIGSIIAYSITVILSAVISIYLLSPSISEPWKSIIRALLIVAAVIGCYAAHRFLTWLRDGITYRFLRKKLGIVEIFKNLVSCEHLIKKDFAKAKKTKLFLQIGRRQLGGATASMFGELAERKTEGDDDIRVLHASEDSNYVIEGAKKRKSSLEYLLQGIGATEKQIDYLKREKNVRIESKTHHEPFVWKFFIFDDIAYVMGYTPGKTDETSIVYKIRDGEHSLYRFFNKYFDDLWEIANDKNHDLMSQKRT